MRNPFQQMANNHSIRKEVVVFPYLNNGDKRPFEDFPDKKTWKYLYIFLFISFIYFCQIEVSFGQTNDSVLVKKIFISGNELTKELVVLREITFHEGDYIKLEKRLEKFNQSEKFLINTSLFHKVNITDSISGSNDYVFIKLKERFPAIPDFQIKSAASNLNQWLVQPTLYRLTYGAFLPIKDFRGRNETLTLSAVFGWRETFGIDYKIPYLNRNKTFGVEASFTYQQGHEVSYLTENNKLDYVKIDSKDIFEKTSCEVDLIYRRKHQVTHTFTWGYDYYSINDTVKKLNPDYLGENRNTIKVPRLLYKLVYDKRDYSFYARKGDYMMASIEQDGLPFGLNEVNVTTLDLTYRKFIPLGSGFFYEGEFTGEYDLQRNLPYIFRSSLGYRYQVIGFEHFVDDGNGYFIVMNELKYLTFSSTIHILKSLDKGGFSKFNAIPVSIYLKVFANEGEVFNPIITFDNSLLNKTLSSIGVGADIITYYDKIIRVEYCINNLGKWDVFLHLTEVF